jgi:rieske iron-sulfur protein
MARPASTGLPAPTEPPLGLRPEHAAASRRAVLWGACGAAVMGVMPLPAAGDAVRDMRAQPGDLLVAFKNDDGAGAIINPGDVKRGAEPLLAWPFDPAKMIVRSGSRLNLVILMNFDPATLSAAERGRAAGGVVAYTAVCTHQACWVTDWLQSKQVLQCPCHQSQYDPRQGARVVTGPAPRPLPALPVRLADGRLEVKGPFTDRVGGAAPSG